MYTRSVILSGKNSISNSFIGGCSPDKSSWEQTEQCEMNSLTSVSLASVIISKLE